MVHPSHGVVGRASPARRRVTSSTHQNDFCRVLGKLAPALREVKTTSTWRADPSLLDPLSQILRYHRAHNVLDHSDRSGGVAGSHSPQSLRPPELTSTCEGMTRVTSNTLATRRGRAESHHFSYGHPVRGKLALPFGVIPPEAAPHEIRHLLGDIHASMGIKMHQVGSSFHEVFEGHRRFIFNRIDHFSFEHIAAGRKWPQKFWIGK